jgi:uncharacterized lipoprotein
MKSLMRNARPLVAGAIVLALLASSGCRWFRSSDYTRSAEQRPLEVPPDLDRPSTDNQLPLPSAAGLGGSGPAPAGFVVADTPENVWPRLGAALAGIEGVVVTGQAQALHSYDVSYQGQSFLLRVETTAGQSRISAISPTGIVLRAGPAAVLMDQLRTRL